MAGLPTQNLPAQNNDPISALDSRARDYQTLLHKQYTNDSSALEQQYLTDEQYQGKLAELNAHYSNLAEQSRMEFDGTKKQMMSIRNMIGQGEIDPQEGEKAAWGMVLPSSTLRAMYPTQAKEATPTRPLSPGSFGSSDKLMMDFISGAEDERGLEWGEPRKNKSSLIESYINWRAQTGYDNLDPLHQRQLDMRWDAIMKADKRYRDWFSDKKQTSTVAEVQSLRSKGAIGKAMQKKVVGPIASKTPIGRSLSRPSNTPTRAPSVPTADDLKAQGTKQAYEQGVKLGYWK